jgi:arylsulfatase A-like enzyme
VSGCLLELASLNIAYAAVQLAADMSVQRIIQLLNKLQIRDNTLVIIASDNGGDPSEYGVQ